MVKACCDKVGVKTGKWSAKEDQILVSYIQRFGHDQNWHSLTKKAGLLRCGKSCRFRWLNYLRPNIKRGNYTRQEEEVIISLHRKLGNRWSVMAKSLPGRTDNEIKNYWYTHLKKDNSENEEIAETRQLSVENSASSANKERELQPIPYSMILECPGHDLTYPQSFSNNSVSDNGSSVINGKKPNEVVLDESMQSESTYEFGSSVGSQSQSAEGLTPKDCSPSTFEDLFLQFPLDLFLQFPLSPLSFGEYDDYMGVCCKTETDVLFNYYEEEGEIPYII